MAAKPGSDANQTGNQGKGDRLPFEPSSSRKKERRREAAASADAAKSAKASKSKSSTQASTAKTSTAKASTANGKTVAKSKAETRSGKVADKDKAPAPPQRKYTREETAIPEAVSQRMIKRMAVLCGIPTALGISTFVVSYFIVSNGVVDLPPVAVLLVSLGFFGLGVLGISYGALSTSWDVHYEGSALGWTEFKLNFGRMRQAWKESREQKRS